MARNLVVPGTTFSSLAVTTGAAYAPDHGPRLWERRKGRDPDRRDSVGRRGEDSRPAALRCFDSSVPIGSALHRAYATESIRGPPIAGAWKRLRGGAS